MARPSQIRPYCSELTLPVPPKTGQSIRSSEQPSVSSASSRQVASITIDRRPSQDGQVTSPISALRTTYPNLVAHPVCRLQLLPREQTRVRPRTERIDLDDAPVPGRLAPSPVPVQPQIDNHVVQVDCRAH